MKKKFISSLMMAVMALPSLFAADYGLPTNIQDGNILHCFDWTMAEVKANLANIAAAGYGSVQLSPLQRSDVRTGSPWHDLYRPYDLAFKGGLGSESELKDLCSAAATYGIKVIVDVVANHVDKTSGYHDPWWDQNGRQRNNGGIDYNNRYSITHNNLGDYYDVNSESAEVQARAKAYIEKLKECGVKGIRWDAAKHIALPSEGCNFWSTVTSVSGLWHYGEILNDDGTPINEYAKYMSVTDNRYSNSAAQNNGGIQQGYGGAWAVDRGVASNKLVYWGESHDTYSNDEWSQNVDQSVIDRAYACVATRNGATALYFARPNAKGFNNIKVGKGTDAYKSASIAAVNKLRNAAGSAADYCTTQGNNFSCTRKGIGAVIVTRGSGNVTIANGGGYCPTGSYKDLVSGGTFTVTDQNISGNVGSSGIAVIIKDGVAPTPNPDPNPDPTPVTGSMWLLGNLAGTAGWSTTPGTGIAMTQSGNVYTASNVEFVTASGETTSFFNITDFVGSTWDDLNMSANRYGAATEGAPITIGTPATVVKYANGVDASGCLSWTVAPGKYDVKFDASAMTVTVTNAGSDPNPNPNPDPEPTPDPTPSADHYIYYDGTISSPYVWAWVDGGANCTTSGAWPGDKMTKNGSLWYWELPSGKPVPTNVIISGGDDASKIGGGDLVYVDKATYHQDGSYTQGTNPNPNPDPTPTPSGDVYVYVEGLTAANIYVYNDGGQMTTWDAAPAMTSDASTGYLAYKLPDDYKTSQVIIKNGGEQYPGANEPGLKVNGKSMKLVWSSKTWAEYQGGNPTPDPTKPVVTATPGSQNFTDRITVTLSSSPAGTIYYTDNGSVPTTSSAVYSTPITFTATTTLKAYAVASDGTVGDVSTFTYTKSSTPNPTPQPSGNNLITDYYKVNPDGKVGSNKTINMSFNGLQSTTALSNWTDAELIAQGVARDVCQAMKGKHERPVIDSYALYAAYDNDYLYLGVQFVYTVWDLYGEGKQPGESKPYNMDGRLMWAFDLDPNKSFDGYINGTGAIWNDNGAPGAKFENGVDAVWIGSSKPGVGTPGFFIATPDGHASYDAAYCKSISGSYYGYADGVLPSISAIYGQSDFEFDPEALKGNSGFTDLTGEIDASAHTFYEWKLPLSVLGITADYIRNTGIGVQYLDVYGSSPVGGTPYDPSFFDNVKDSYGQDPSSSKEKEDEDIITFAPARIGKLLQSSAISSAAADKATTVTVKAVNGGIRVSGLNGEKVIVAGIDGKVYYNDAANGSVSLDLNSGVYVVNVDGNGTRVLVK